MSAACCKTAFKLLACRYGSGALLYTSKESWVDANNGEAGFGSEANS